MTAFPFRTSTGRLTAYSFSCGYRERRSTDRAGYGKTDWIQRFTTMVPFITYVSTIDAPNQLSSESSGSLTELLQSSQLVQPTAWQVDQLIVVK